MVPESRPTGITFPYEPQAMNGNEMPDGLEYPDQILYLCFRMLYAQLKGGIIDRQTATQEKRKLIRQYEADKLVEQRVKECVEIIRKTEIARADYRKDRTLENADRLDAAIEGVLHE